MWHWGQVTKLGACQNFSKLEVILLERMLYFAPSDHQNKTTYYRIIGRIKIIINKIKKKKQENWKTQNDYLLSDNEPCELLIKMRLFFSFFQYLKNSVFSWCTSTLSLSQKMLHTKVAANLTRNNFCFKRVLWKLSVEELWVKNQFLPHLTPNCRSSIARRW